MFIVTPEQQKFADAMALREPQIRRELAALDVARRQLPNQHNCRFDSDEDRESKLAAALPEREKLDAQQNALVEELNALTLSPLTLAHRMKSEINATAGKFLPPGGFTVVLDMADEAIASLDGETAQRVLGLARNVAVKALTAAADPDLHAAYAKVSAARYKALTDAGLPESVAAQIVVKEAGTGLTAFASKATESSPPSLASVPRFGLR